MAIIIKRLIGLFFLVLGFLTVTFFRKYSGEAIPYPFFFWLGGFAMMWAAWALFKSAGKAELAEDKSALQLAIDELKANGEKIKADLRQCEIKQNNYYRQVADDTMHISSYTPAISLPYQFKGIDGMTRDPKRAEVIQSVILFTHDSSGGLDTFSSGLIPFQRESLLFRMENQKETFIYVDKNDRQRYYFDLEFLYQ